MRPDIDPVFGLLATAAVSLLMAAAGVAKLRDLTRFSAVLEGYAVLPPALVPLIARLLPALEVAIAIGLIWPVTRNGAAWAAGGLLFIYGAGLGLNLARGRRDLDCGCEGFGRRHPIAAWMLVRNALMIGLAALAGAPASARAIEATDALTIAGGLAAFALVYFAADELLGQRTPV